MSLVNGLKKVAFEFNAGLRILKRNLGLKSTCNGAALGGVKTCDVSYLIPAQSLLLSKNKPEKFCMKFSHAGIAIKKNITEPEKSIKISFELPIKSSTNTFLDLPFYTEKEINEPSSRNVTSKIAKHMIVIRKRKMRRHKYKKYLKKKRVQLQNIRIRRKINKEKEFEKSLSKILCEADAFSPENYVKETLEKVHWKKPITRVKGFLAPKWVVKQHLEEKERRRIIRERVNECLK